MEVERAPEPPRRGAGALLAIGVMAAIALVTAGTVVAWARLAPPQAEAIQTGLDEELPEALADGSAFTEVPAAVAGAVEAPVVGALRRDEVPGEFPGCEDFGMPLENSRLEAAFVTSDALVVSYLGDSEEFLMVEQAPGDPAPAPGLGRVRLGCSASWDGGWILDGTGGISMSADEVMGASGTSSGCCGADGLSTATTLVSVPEDARWLIQDRGEYRLAYDVEGLEGMALSWRYREGPFRPSPSSTITFVDGAGDVVEETVVGF